MVVSFSSNSGVFEGDVVLPFCYRASGPDVQAHAPGSALFQVHVAMSELQVQL